MALWRGIYQRIQVRYCGPRLFALHPSWCLSGHLFVAKITSDVLALARSLVRKPSASIHPTRFYACMSAYFDLRACTEIHGYACTYTHPCILSSGSSQTLPLETVEFALERVFASKKYGRAVPELLLLSIREAANDGTNQFICALLREGWYRVLSVGNSLGFVIDDSRRFGRHEFQICVANGSL